MNSTASPTPYAPPPLPQARTSALAVASLILGMLGFLIVPALAGLVCGIVAMSQIKRSAGALKGHGVALAGTIVSALMLALVPVLAIMAGMLLPALANAKSKAQVIMSINNVRQLALGVVIHANDHDDKFPGAANWADTITPMVGSPKAFERPTDPSGARSGYGYNARVAGMKLSDVPKDTVLIFELESGGWNISGGPELLRRPRNRGDPVVVGFADGHAEAMTGSRLDTLRWDP